MYKLRNPGLKRTHRRGQHAFSVFQFCTALLLCSPAGGQVLFSFGKHQVSREEFLQAYNRNNSGTPTPVPYADYLDMYVNYRMKVQAAVEAGMDTLPQQKQELIAFRQQLAENFLREDASIKVLVDEALERSRRDIRLHHLYIPFPPGTAEDTARTEEKIDSIYQQLQHSPSFEQLASLYSGSDMGYITVFVLPYAIENIAYTLPLGSYSRPYRSSHGFHIIKKTAEREAAGSVRVAQILVGFPPGMTPAIKKALASRADSLYRELKKGAGFAELAKQVSDDHLSRQAGGELPAFGVGRYDTLFENKAFSIPSDGDITEPFETSFGFHILKRIQRIPAANGVGGANVADDRAWKEVMKERVMQSDRMEVAQARLIENIRKIIASDAEPSDLSSDTAALRFYRDHLEKYNSEFAGQLNEFRQGNLLFGIMQEKVWDAATGDSTGLRKFYSSNRERYHWENSADALVITSLSPAQTEKLRAEYIHDISRWRHWADMSSGLVIVDSGRFELNQLPGVNIAAPAEGSLSMPVPGEQDSSATMVYVIKTHPGREPKTFEEARGLVINDYQEYLEEKWMADLRRKYPLKVNRKVLASLP